MIDVFNAELILKFVEILGLITGVIYVIGAILEKKWCWYFGIIAVISYAISTYFYKLYGEFVLQFFYLAISFYGLLQWNTKNTAIPLKEKTLINELRIEFSSIKSISTYIFIGAVLSYFIYLGLVYFKSSYPFWDAITSSFGIIATYLTVKKKIDNWILWIIIDAILSVVLYLKEMPFYSFLYLIYLIFAYIGFLKWKSEIEKYKLKI